MPIYEYMCESCGPFEEMRAMARHADPYECPGCGTMAPRVVLTAPRLAAMPAERRVAYSRNEQSAHAPFYEEPELFNQVLERFITEDTSS